MVAQKSVDLNQPLDASALAKLEETDLTPELAQAALTLHGDYYRQVQGVCNKYLFWHPFSVSVCGAGTAMAAAYLVRDYYAIAKDIPQLVTMFWYRRDIKYDLIFVMPVIVMIMGVLALCAHLLSEDLRDVADNLDKPERIEELFGYDLRQYAKVDEEKRLNAKETTLVDQGKNTHLMVYRNSPIAVVTVKPGKTSSGARNSTESEVTVRITGLHVRKVFAKADLHTLLMDWALERAQKLGAGAVGKRGQSEPFKIHVLIEAFSFDKQYVNFLRGRSFSRVSSSTILDSRKPGSNLVQSINKLLGLSRDTYGLTFIVEGKETKTVPYYKRLLCEKEIGNGNRKKYCE